MEYPISEGIEVSDTKTNSFEHLCLVIAAFREAVGVWDIEAVENLELPSLGSRHNYREETRKGVAVEYVPNAQSA